MLNLPNGSKPCAWRTRWIYDGVPGQWSVTSYFRVARDREEQGAEVEPLFTLDQAADPANQRTAK
jgi:hypothetical protein